jgi:hypothetical protein
MNTTARGPAPIGDLIEPALPKRQPSAARSVRRSGAGGPRRTQWPSETELAQFETLSTSVDIARALYRFKDPDMRARLARRHPRQRAAYKALAAIEQLEQRDAAPEGPTPRPLTREAPRDEAQLDFLVPFPHDIASKDAVRLMECAPFRLSNRPSPQQKQLTYVLGSTVVEFIPHSEFGLPTARDYDFVQFLCSHLQEAVNRGDIPDRTFLARGYEFLRFARRDQGGKQHDQIEPMIDRLQGTVVKRYSLGPNGERGPPEWLPLVGYCKVLTYTPSGKVDQIRVDIPLWLYEAIVGNSVRGDRPHVLTLNRDYYLLTASLDRFLYRFARHRAGKSSAVIALADLHSRSGSTRDLRFFRGYVRNLPGGRVLEYRFTLKRSRRQENVHIDHVTEDVDAPDPT